MKRNPRRAVMSLAAIVFGLAATLTHAQDQLPSWNDGPAKQAILEFVKATTQGGSQFVPPEARIATFDQDGTLWVEHPIYSQVMYCLDRVPVIADRHPELRYLPPFSTVLSGNHEEIAKLSKLDLEMIAVTTLTDMTTDIRAYWGTQGILDETW